MLFADHLVMLRGGGDLATGVAWRLHAAGFPVAVLELAEPLTVRRTVALSTAVTDGTTDVEGLQAERVTEADSISGLAATGVVPVLVSDRLVSVPATVVVDARLAKRNLGTSMGDAPLVVALGPGFTAGEDCHAVIETARGPDLGRVLWDGPAAADTATPGLVGGRTVERVLRAPSDGVVRWDHHIGDRIADGEPLGAVGDQRIVAPFEGVVRGLIADGIRVQSGRKVGDVDPRSTTRCDRISDKALAVGGGATEAVLSWLNRSS